MKCKKNVPRAGQGENFNFFDFSKSFQNWRKLSLCFHFRTTKISKFTHLEEKDSKEWNAKKKKMSLGPLWAKTSIFSIFRKGFKSEGNYHIFTLGQLKYQNSLIWKKKMPKSELQKKNVPRAGVGENFNFFNFSKSFQNWRKLSYFHFRTTKISKFTHLEEKDAKIHSFGRKRWKRVKCKKNVPRASVGENFNFFDFSKFSKLKETIIFSL